MPATKLYFQNHGFLGCDLRWFLIGRDYASSTTKQAETHWYHAPTNTAVLEHPDGRILFDTSCPRDWRARWEESGNTEWNPYESVTEEQYLDSSLQRLGLTPSDFSMVVLSHLHFDHAGNLALFRDTDAKLITQRVERDGAFSIPGSFAGAHLRDDYERYAFETVEGDVEIADGVRLLLLPGHTWGTMGMMFDLPNTGTVILTSDAVYMGDSYGPPATPDPIAWSSLDWLNSVERVRQLAEKHNATLFFGHDHEQVTGSRRIAPEYYD